VSKRAAFHRMMQDAQRRRFDAVIVHKLDRFARSVVVALGTFKLLSELGISFLTLSEQGMDVTTPLDKVLCGMRPCSRNTTRRTWGWRPEKGQGRAQGEGAVQWPGPLRLSQCGWRHRRVGPGHPGRRPPRPRTGGAGAQPARDCPGPQPARLP